MGLLERFGGYTLTSLLSESEDLLRYVNLVEYGQWEVA